MELNEGDGEHVSHCLLGIFDPIAPAVVVAVDRLAAGHNAGYHEILDPTVVVQNAARRFHPANHGEKGPFARNRIAGAPPPENPLKMRYFILLHHKRRKQWQ